MAHDVFISHSTEDKPAADAICAILEENGVRCWIAPRDIMPGADWGESIVKGIRSSRVVLLVFSTNANRSKQIKREVEIAADGGVTIVPLRIENILPAESFKYFLGNIHWLDALTPPLEKHLKEVAAKVKAILSTESVDSPGASQPSSPERPLPVQQPARRKAMPVIGVIVTAALAAFVFWRLSSRAPAPAVPINRPEAMPAALPSSVAPSSLPDVRPSPIPSPPASATAMSPSVSPVLPARVEPSSAPAGASKPDPPISDPAAMILGILRAIETHDSQALLAHTVNGQTDYFGHKNASTAFIRNDMERDAKAYKYLKFVPDLTTFQASPGRDSIEYDSDALDVRGKRHKARCRLNIYYAPGSSSQLQALSLEVLPS
ncbi:MAG: TIR domain-containing protein [Terrimicrobiaceae bacterium]